VSAPAVRIRAGDPQDLPAVQRIERASFADPWPATALLQELAPSALRLPLILEVGGTVIGYLMAWHTPDQLHVLNVAIDPAHRRQGHGRRLLEVALTAARRTGAREVTLEVRPGNTAALAMYRALGFQQTGRRPHYYADTGEDALVLSCTVDAAPGAGPCQSP
jgi:ribosomal-protein-alanine N-acetyltransferase